MVGHGLDSFGSGYGPFAGCCEHDNDPSGSIKCCDLLDYLNNCEVIRKDFAARS
jgi:hypothetical protein